MPRLFLTLPAAALIVLVAGCNGTPTKQEISSRLRKDDNFSILNDRQRDCMASVMLRYGEGASLRQYVDGAIKFTDVKADKDGKDKMVGESSACVADHSR